MAEGYTKLFSGIVMSTVWSYDSDTKVIWVTMLALADETGVVVGTVPGLAKVAGVSLEATRKALATFLSPDPDSGSKDFEGRRIEVIDRGWALLNHAKYRAMRSREQKLEADRIRIAEKRAAEKPTISDMSHSVASSRVESRPVADVAQAEAEADPDSLSLDPQKPPERAIHVAAPRTTAPVPSVFRAAAVPYPVGAITDHFLSVFDRYTNQAGRVKAAATWQETALGFPGGEAALAKAIGATFDAGLLKQHPFNAEFKFRPTFEQFLALRRWEDPVVTAQEARSRDGPGSAPVDPYASAPRFNAKGRITSP